MKEMKDVTLIAIMSDIEACSNYSNDNYHLVQEV